MDYIDFLKTKVAVAKQTGFEVDSLNSALFPHQADTVRWCLKGGRRAVFASFGNGKTAMGLELAHKCAEHTGKPSIICLPLGVKQEFIRDAENILGYDKPIYVRNMAEIENCTAEIMLTNYERVRDGDIDPRYFGCTVLDEAAVLRDFGSKTYQTFLNKFKGVPYKFVMTATPDPNKYKELIHYAGYLEIMDTGQALTRFFQRDSTKANNLTIYPHKEREFWLWVSSWALFYTKPSDLNPNYSDDGYDLPKLIINKHRLITKKACDSVEPDGQLKMFDDAAVSLKSAAKIKKESIKQRVAKLKEIVEASPNDHFILWHDREEERHEIKKAVPSAVEVYGSQDLEIREKNIIDFSDGKTQYLATKKCISGSGCNFQRFCHRAIFVGIDYEFNDFIQAVHRIYRFMQTKEVIIDIIYMDTEDEIIKELFAKWDRYNYQTQKMVEILKKYGLSNNEIKESLVRTMGVSRTEVKGTHFAAINNDCVEEMKTMKENSVDLIVTSIPFSNHYEYTPSYNDFGHNENNEKFFEQMDYLTPEALRVLKPGRVACIHVKDRILFGNATGDGMPTVDPFSDMTVMHFIKHGFKYMGRIIIETDVVRENNQTYRLGWTENCKDGTKMGVGCPEYVLLFRKLPTDTSKAYADEPVVKSKEDYSRGRWQLDAHADWRSSGDVLLDKEQIKNMPVDTLQRVYHQYSKTHIYDYKKHVELVEALDKENKLPASFMVCAPASWTDTVWDDINRMRTLNSEQSRRKLQMHVCPLQLDTVERLIDRYSSEGDTVLDFFGGIMTVPYMAVKKGRYGIGIELNSDYFRDGLAYLKAMDAQCDAPTLFDFLCEGA